MCPVDCIHPRKDEEEFEAESMLYIHPDEGIDCEACAPECPVEAIFPMENVPEEWEAFIELNAEMAPQCEVLAEKKEPLVDS